MATSDYMAGRQKYTRPQAMLWAETAGDPINGVYLPPGYEIGSNAVSGSLLDNFLILSDDNRSPIQIGKQRIEKRERMINGNMRSYHIADKLTIDVSWDMLPSRAYYQKPGFEIDTNSASEGKSPYTKTTGEYTTDGGAGGVEILDWYENHTGPFWVYLAYDKYNTFGSDNAAYGHLAQYSDVREMYFSSFQYSIEKRGNGYDFWNIQLTLEEV